MGLAGVSIWQLLIVLLIVAVIFGSKKLRNLGEDLGVAVSAFKRGLNSETDDSQNNKNNSSDSSDNKQDKI